jgi:hypothetical protein
MTKDYPPRLAFQIVRDLLQSGQGVGQLADRCSVYPTHSEMDALFTGFFGG